MALARPTASAIQAPDAQGPQTACSTSAYSKFLTQTRDGLYLIICVNAGAVSAVLIRTVREPRTVRMAITGYRKPAVQAGNASTSCNACRAVPVEPLSCQRLQEAVSLFLLKHEQEQNSDGICS